MHRLAFLLILCLAIPVAAQGDILYGARGDSMLVRIDTSTQVATSIGRIGFSSIGGLAFGNDGTLYGISASSNALLKIDTNTGAGQLIGSVGASIAFSTGMANDPVTDQLYGITQQGQNYSSYLATYSKITGKATGVGDTTGSAVVGRGDDSTGQLWGIDGGGGREELIRIDKATAATTVVGKQGLGQYAGVGCFDVGPSGTFWAVNSSGSTYQLISINSTTGAPTLVGTLTGITSSGVMTGLASLSAARIAASGSPKPGGTVTFSLSATGDAGLTYQVGSSFGTGPIPLDTRLLRLSPDDLLVVSVRGFWPSIFVGYQGVLDGQGKGSAAINLPNLGALVGQRIHSAFVTLSAPAPSGIKSISNTESFAITP